MGRVCTVLPGSTVDGMGTLHARPDVPAAGNGAPSIPVPADPPALGIVCDRGPGARLMPSALPT
jgi:hypothetical protein